MRLTDSIKKYRNWITIILALAGIGLMIYYDYCDTECKYLKGDIWGIDLKWVGSAFMVALIVFTAFQQTPFVRALLAAGLGVEVFLFSFQVQNDVFCPFCLAFAVMVIAAFIVNYEVPSVWHENRRRMWIYFLGEVSFPMFKIQRLPLLVVSILGYLVILLTFSGSTTPAYAQDGVPVIPSLGKGPYEIIMFAAYSCSPCLIIDAKAEPLFKELLATKQVKITFVDVPFSKEAAIYAKYYLYATNADPGMNNVLHVRKILFDAAQVKSIYKEGMLVAYLQEQKIVWKVMDDKSIFPLLNAIINEHDIEATPTCVIKYSAADVEKYVGPDDIWYGLTKLKSHLKSVKKS
jgi:thiol-disulfide isomerase/thioredoxin